MLPRSPLDAYRTDLTATGRTDAFTADDAVWLFAAEVVARRAAAVRRLRRATRLDGAGTGVDAEPDQARYVATLRTVLARGAQTPPGSTSVNADGARELVSLLYPVEPPSPRAQEAEVAVDASSGALFDQVVSLAESVEESGALHLAATLLEDFEAVGDLTPRQRGLLLAQQARVARKLGATALAERRYREVGHLGRGIRDLDLVARGAIGRAVLARRRGNYPESRRLYRRALHAAERGGVRSLVGLAHQGLAIAATVAGDVDAALVHGWNGLAHLEPGTGAYAEALANLAAAASTAGHHRAALRVYQWLAARSTMARIRLPALGGAAVCAAALGDRERLADLTADIERELAHTPLLYEQAHALVLIAAAWLRAEPDTRGEPYRSRAIAAATANGYHELALEAEGLSPEQGDNDPTTPAHAGRRPARTPKESAWSERVRPRAAARRVVNALEAMVAGSEACTE